MGLIPKVSDAFHGFMPEERTHFSNFAIPLTENPVKSLNNILTALLEGFRLSEVSENYVILESFILGIRPMGKTAYHKADKE